MRLEKHSLHFKFVFNHNRIKYCNKADRAQPSTVS